MITLRPHQARLTQESPNQALLFWCMRAGKTLAAALWSQHECRNSAVIIVSKKSNKKEWKIECPHATVYTKEEFKRDWEEIEKCSAIVVDEAHHHLAPLFIPKSRSAQAEALYNFIKKHKPHVLLLSGTPLTNQPASLHTLLTYLGKYIDWKNKFQPYFYSLESRPFLPRPAWMPKKGWRIQADKILRKYADVVELKDCMDFLPPKTIEIIKTKADKYPYAEDEDRSWQKDHRAEQYNKAPAIADVGYRKIIVVCKYTEQIDDLAKKLAKYKPVYVLDGRTKDQAKTIKDAQENPDCYLIVQSSMGEGFDGWQFDCMVFASMDHRFINHQQMEARLINVDRPKPWVYYYLLSDGKFDKLIYNYVVKEGKDAPVPRSPQED